MTEPVYKCRYCNKDFRKESTLTAHQCEQKRRWQQEKDPGVQFGLRAYLRFYEYAQGSAKQKSYADFVTSPYYTAFVKFGWYLVGIRAINVNNFTDWLLKNNKKLDYWAKDTLYTEWMIDYLRKEATQDALERALKEMTEYAETHPELKNGFNDYFRYGNGNRIVHHISTGRISPWILYNCTSGIEFLESLMEEQIAMILPYIDPDFWQKKFKEYPEDVAWVKMVTEAANL